MPPITKLGITAVLVSVTFLTLAGCKSSQNKQSGFNSVTGKHVANWYVDHRAAYRKDATGCSDCHGTDLKGGISSVSCYSASYSGMTCHANGPTGHPTGWENPESHGVTAKSAPTTTSGFSFCQTCHGDDFTGGIAMQTCLDTAGCHGAGVLAPHASAWMPTSTYTHISTDQGNASVCALCHANGLNSPVAPPSPAAPAGTAPGCYNSTLCHAVPGHADIATWSLSTGHGASAKAAPNVGKMSGFSTCQICHNTDFTGGIALQTCLNTAGCHGAGVLSPHSPKPWRGAPGAVSHVSTDPANGTVCSLCHTNGANSSVKPSSYDAVATAGCFNNTLCHAVPTQCVYCHSNPPSGTTSPNQAGSHAIHNDSTWTNVTGVCDTCHSGAGIGTSKHNNGTADVAVSSTYNAKTGSAAYNAAGFSCSNVSCHGGQTTPNWLTGTINVNTQCGSCHSPGQTQYNGYFSGYHSTHLGSDVGAVCTDCHDTTKLSSVHFNNLSTTAMISSYLTISSGLNYTGTATALGTCTFNCHGEIHAGRQW